MKHNLLMVGAAETGGVANYIKTLAPYLDHFYNVYMTIANWGDNSPNLNSPIKIIDFDAMYSAVTLYHQQRVLRDIIKENHIDVIHLHTLRAGFLGSIATIGMSIPVIYTAHGWRFEQKDTPLERYLFLQFDKFVCRRANQITCIRRKDYCVGLEHRLSSKENLILIPTQIERAPHIVSRHMNSMRASWCVPNEGVVIGNIAELTKRKDPITFFKAAKIIRDNYPDAFFVWVGDGELRDQIEQWANLNGLEGSYRITGRVPHEDIFSWVDIFDIFLMTSKVEGIPLSLLEAQAAGKIIISSQFSGVEEVITDGVTGYTFPVGDHMRAAECVAKTLTHRNQVMEIAAIGKKVFDHTRGNPEKMAEDYLKIYQRAYDQLHSNHSNSDR